MSCEELIFIALLGSFQSLFVRQQLLPSIGFIFNKANFITPGVLVIWERAFLSRVNNIYSIKVDDQFLVYFCSF